MPSTRLQVLADFIRTKRRNALLLDGMACLPGRRRTPGLRREELGLRAGLSADWIARIEQARDVRLSLPAARRLAAALRLNADETAYLLELADDSGAHPPPDGAAIPSALPAILAAQGPNPAYVADRQGDLVLWNPAAGLLFEEFGRARLGRANVMLYWFLDASARRVLEWEHHARRMIAHARLRQGALGESDVITALRRTSAEFEQLWLAHDVMQRSSGRKTLRHPGLGEIAFDYCSFQAADDNLTMTLMAIAPECHSAELAAALQARPECGRLDVG